MLMVRACDPVDNNQDLAHHIVSESLLVSLYNSVLPTWLHWHGSVGQQSCMEADWMYQSDRKPIDPLHRPSSSLALPDPNCIAGHLATHL